MALFSPCAPTTFFTLSSSSKPSPSHKPHLTLKNPSPLFVTRSSPENGASAAAAVVEEIKKEPLGLKSEEEDKEEEEGESLDSNGVALKAEAAPAFKDPRWVRGTWDLKQFDKGGITDWYAVIDAG